MPYYKRIAPEIEQSIIADYTTKRGVPFIVNKFGVTDVTVYNILRRHGVQTVGRVRFPKKREDYLSVIDTCEKAYFVGLVASDGCIDTTNRGGRIRIGLQESDKRILQRYSEIILGEVSVNTYPSTIPNRKPLSWLDISSRLMTEDLARLGIKPNKSFNANVDMSGFTPDLFRAFLLGLSDGDGAVYYSHRKGRRKGLIYSVVCSLAIAHKIEEGVYRALGLRFCKEVKQCQKGELIYLRLNHQDKCLQFLEWLYGDSTDCIDRKRLVFEEFREYRAAVAAGTA